MQLNNFDIATNGGLDFKISAVERRYDVSSQSGKFLLYLAIHKIRLKSILFVDIIAPKTFLMILKIVFVKEYWVLAKYLKNIRMELKSFYLNIILQLIHH